MVEYQMPFTQEADSTLKVSEWATYFVYNLTTLKTMGFRHNRNAGANIFTYCVFCKRYSWFEWFWRPTFIEQEITVCTTCHNHCSGHKLRAF